ncbi:MAG: MFS transporter [Candidatus Moranbacteria bacterium]|nr:MFS transporter [Candidatus Moranbacteria bacterium]
MSKLLDLVFRRRSEKSRRESAHRINLVSFLFGFTDSFYAYVLSIYFSRVIGSDNVGGFYLVAYAVIFVLLWFLHRIMRKIGGSVISFFLAILAGVIFATILTVIPVTWPGAILAILLLISTNVAWVALDVALEQSSEDGVTGAVRGLHLTMINAGFLIAPFLATRIVDLYDFGGVFFGVTLGLSIVLAIAIVLLHDRDGISTTRMEARSAWKKMLREPNLMHIYNVSFGLGFFYFIMVIYTPIHLVNLGFTWQEIGILFTIMLVPFVLLQYPLGVLADKKYGEKEFLLASIGFSLIATLSFSLISSNSLLFWGMLLFISRIGAAGIEVLRDSYFYKHVDGGDDDLISFFRTAYPAANIAGALLATPLLLFFPLRSVFYLVTIVLLFSLYSAFRLEDTK